MKKLVYTLLGLFAISSLTSCGYNSMVELDESVKSQWGQVQNVYKRRSDLIPNLVASVKGAAGHEKETLTAVQEARSKATSIQVDPTKLDPAQIQKFNEAQGQLSTALGRLMMVTENYPDLKANQNFLQLQEQIEGAENRITIERQKFNEVTKTYNSAIRKFPNNLTASMFGFEQKGYFEADPASQNAPKVEF